MLTNRFISYTLSWCLMQDSIYLISGDSDFEVCVWHYNNDNLSLIWASQQLQLCATAANITAAKLSTSNANLLTQHQIFDETEITEQQLPKHLYQTANIALKQQQFAIALDLFKLVAAKNHLKAKTSLGNFYASPEQTGQVVTTDYDQTLALFTETAVAGHERAQHNLKHLKKKLPHY